MEYKYTKHIKTLAIAAILSSNSMFAQGKSPSTQQPCVQLEPFCDQGHAAEPYHMMKGFNAPSRIDTYDYDLFFGASFIYWQANQEGMAYAIENYTPANNRIFPNADAQWVNIDFPFSPGFRISAGYGMDYGDWAVMGEYTRLHQLTSDSASAENIQNGGNLPPQWLSAANQITLGANFQPTSIDATWKFNLDVFDFHLNRASYVGNRLSFTPHFGGRLLWINQRYKLDYTDSINQAFFRVNVQSGSWAVGARAGLDTMWYAGCGFRVIGNVSSSLLYTGYKAKHFEGTLVDTNNDYIVSTKDFALKPNLELDLGLGWGSYLYGSCYHVDFSATYDFQVFWAQNYMFWLQQESINRFVRNGGDLFLQGLTINGRFDF